MFFVFLTLTENVIEQTKSMIAFANGDKKKQINKQKIFFLAKSHNVQ